MLQRLGIHPTLFPPGFIDFFYSSYIEKPVMFGFFKKKKNKIQQLIEERGYEQAVALLAGSIIERLPNRAAAYEFMLQELDGASMGNEDSKRAAANSGIPSSHYKAALNKDVPAIESAQDNITNYSLQLAHDQELMARLRVDIGVEVMKHFEFGRFSHSFGTFEPPIFGDDEDLGRNFVITPDGGFRVTDRDTGDVLQAVIKDGMFHGTVFINAICMSSGLAPWPLHSNPFKNEMNFCGSGNSPAGPWEFSITPSVPFGKIIELALAQRVLNPPAVGGVKKRAAEAAYERGDFATALKEFRVRADQGEAVAQYFLGLLYHKGRGVPYSFVQAAEWYRRAAVQGHCHAQSNLGALFVEDIENQDYAECVRWTRMAAEQGDAFAQDNLGIFYSTGRGVAKDLQQAIEWYRLAAQSGFANALFHLGQSYQFGKGVAKDVVEAFELYHRAAIQGHAEAQFNLGTLFYQGDGVAKDLLEAAHWYRLAAGQGLPSAQRCLAGMLCSGEGVDQDMEEGVALYQLAAAQGDADSQTSLGLLYSTGDGVAKNSKLALDWLLHAAEKGFARAQFNLGVIYFNGTGVEKDHIAALRWYRLAADGGHVNAQINLATMYWMGQGVAQNLAEASRLFSSLADSGNALAQVNLGSMAYTGQGCEVDFVKAANLFRLAGEQGISEAQRSYGVMLSRGEGVDRDDAEAARWFRRAIAQGNKGALLNLRALESKIASA